MFLKSLVIQLLGKFGFTIQSVTSKSKVLSLIRKLKPFQTNHKLIRLGPIGDGGYLVPDDLDGILACFSPGIGTTTGFEEDCLRRGLKIHALDGSIPTPSIFANNTSVTFVSKFLGSYDYGNIISLSSWMNSFDHINTGDFMIQMDIEGSEYFSILNTSDFLLSHFE